MRSRRMEAQVRSSFPPPGHYHFRFKAFYRNHMAFRMSWRGAHVGRLFRRLGLDRPYLGARLRTSLQRLRGGQGAVPSQGSWSRPPHPQRAQRRLSAAGRRSHGAGHVWQLAAGSAGPAACRGTSVLKVERLRLRRSRWIEPSWWDVGSVELLAEVAERQAREKAEYEEKIRRPGLKEDFGSSSGEARGAKSSPLV